MKEFTGGGLTISDVSDAGAKNEVIALILGRSGALRLFILPAHWKSQLKGPTEGWSVEGLPRVPVGDLAKEAVTGTLIMEQREAVVTISRGVPLAIIVPANPYWRRVVRERTG
jgi:hypothetical protein